MAFTRIRHYYYFRKVSGPSLVEYEPSACIKETKKEGLVKYAIIINTLIEKHLFEKKLYITEASIILMKRI